MKSMKTIDLAYMAVGAVLLTVCSWLSIHILPDVPFTLQTFAVFFLLVLLGGKRGTISIIVYILLGLVGVPVFAGFTATSALFGNTGGYIIGFVLSGVIYWIAEKIFKKFKLPIKIAVLVIGLIVCYAFGTAWFMIVYARGNGPIGLGVALGWCVIPFIIPDLVKLVLAVLLGVSLKKPLRIV